MKIKLNSNSIRIRINQKELIAISLNETVSTSIQFSAYEFLTCHLEPWNLEVLEAKFESGKLTVQIPISFAESWPQTPGKSIDAVQENGSTTPLFILVEKDFEKG